MPGSWKGCAEQLRQAYLAAGQHLVERLFALNLLGLTRERDELLGKAPTVPYLTDRQMLAAYFRQMDEKQAWSLVVQPLLDSEVKLLQTPPDLARLQTPAATEMSVRARAKSVHGSTTLYEGKVQVRLGHLEIGCERLTVIQEPAQPGMVLAGSSSLVVTGIRGLDSVRADRFTFSSDTGSFTFGGDVRVSRREGLLKLRSAA